MRLCDDCALRRGHRHRPAGACCMTSPLWFFSISKEYLCVAQDATMQQVVRYALARGKRWRAVLTSTRNTSAQSGAQRHAPPRGPRPPRAATPGAARTAAGRRTGRKSPRPAGSWGPRRRARSRCRCGPGNLLQVGAGEAGRCAARRPAGAPVVKVLSRQALGVPGAGREAGASVVDVEVIDHLLQEVGVAEVAHAPQLLRDALARAQLGLHQLVHLGLCARRPPAAGVPIFSPRRLHQLCHVGLRTWWARLQTCPFTSRQCTHGLRGGARAAAGDGA
jgi:hypothetical protein